MAVEQEDLNLAGEALSALSCSYFQGIGVCSGYCHEEPVCQTNEPSEGWERQLLTAAQNIAGLHFCPCCDRQSASYPAEVYCVDCATGCASVVADIYALGKIVDCERKLKEAGDAIFGLSDSPYRDPRARAIWDDIWAIADRVTALSDDMPEANFG